MKFGYDSSMSSDLLPVDSSLMFKLIRVVNLVARPFNESIGKQNQLSLSEWRAMMVLASHPGSSASDVADWTGMDKMSISRAIAGLHKRDRIVKKDDPNDQRKSLLFLSAKGERLFERIGTQARRREEELFSGASRQELERFDATLEKLVAALGRLEAK